MRELKRRGLTALTFLGVILTLSQITQGQIGGATRSQPQTVVVHRIDGRIQQRNGSVDNIRVRLVKVPQMQPIADTFTTRDGQFDFQRVPTGDYLIQTFETDRYEATETTTSVYPTDLLAPRPTSVTVFIVLPLKAEVTKGPPGELMADVDLNVPKQAVKHYETGMKRLAKGNSEPAITEFRAAIEIFPDYYAARLELGRELRLQKRYPEALATIEPITAFAPKHAEPRIERGIILLALERRDDAVQELEAALRLNEVSWAAHLYLGWALLEQDENKAEPHFQRAIEIDEHKAARAHLALARIAESRGQRAVALTHLDAYLELAPKADDADATRSLAARLRSQP